MTVVTTFFSKKDRQQEKVKCMRNDPELLKVTVMSPEEDVIVVVNVDGGEEYVNGCYPDGAAMPRVGGVVITAKSAEADKPGIVFYSNEKRPAKAAVEAKPEDKKPDDIKPDDGKKPDEGKEAVPPTNADTAGISAVTKSRAPQIASTAAVKPASNGRAWAIDGCDSATGA